MSGLAIGIAFCSAVAFALATSLQHQAAESAPASLGGSFELVRHLFGRPVWLLGQVLSLTGLVLHSAALSIGSIALVQPVVISGVVLAVPIRAALSRRRPWPREMAAVGITAVGLTIFLIASDPTPGTAGPDDARALLVVAMSAAVAGVAALLARRSAEPAQKSFLLGIASGALFGTTAGLIKCVVNAGAQGGLAGVATSWTTWTLVLVGGVALLNNQSAYRLARLSASMPASNVVNGVMALLFGMLAFDEVPRHTPVFVALQLLAFGAIGAGLVIVAKLADREPETAGASSAR